MLSVFTNISNGYTICNTPSCLAGIGLKIFPEWPLASHIPFLRYWHSLVVVIKVTSAFECDGNLKKM